jgi:ribonuclease J
VIIAMFASNIHRIQSAIDASRKFGRKFAVLGKSIEETVEVGRKMGFLDFPANAKLSLEQMKKVKPSELTVITTGSQGEPMSALNKMARQEYKYLTIDKADTIIISAIPIPGNEKAVGRNVDFLFRLGANVVYEADSAVHVSGHAKQEEQKLLLSLVKPKYFMPVHGEFRHLKYHAKLAETMGIPSSNIFLLENGDILDLTPEKAGITGHTHGGSILVDGLGRVGEEDVVLHERRILAQEGVLSVTVVLSAKEKKLLADPLIKTKGCVYVKESQDLIGAIIKETRACCKRLMESDVLDNKRMRRDIGDHVRDVVYDQTHRRPVVLVAVIDVKS